LLKRPSLFAHGFSLRDSPAVCEHLFEHLLWQLGVCPSGCCLPRPTVASHTRSRLPCQRSCLRELAVAGPAFRVRKLDAAQSPPAQETAFLRTLPGASWASSEAVGGQNRCTLRQASMPSSTAVQTGVALPERRGPERGTIEQQRQAVQPKSLKRTAGAVSSDSGLWSFSLRGAAVACMGRSLSSQTLGARGWS